MIHQRSALYRQAQEFFRNHLVGMFRWDQAMAAKAEMVHREPGKPLDAGKTHDQVSLMFGRFDLEMIGPFEHPPCGMIRISTGQRSIDGPLDATTWNRVADFIKANTKPEEINHGSTAGDDWGR